MSNGLRLALVLLLMSIAWLVVAHLYATGAL